MNESEEKQKNQGEPAQPKAPRKRATPAAKAETPPLAPSEERAFVPAQSGQKGEGAAKPESAAPKKARAPKAKTEGAPEKAADAVASAASPKARPDSARAEHVEARAPKPQAAAGKAPSGAKGKGKPEAALEEPPAPTGPLPPPRLLDKHRKTVGPALMKEFSYKSPMQVPTVRKMVVNIGMGEALTNPKAIENATADISAITGQKPVTTKAKKSIAAFKVRQGQVIGLSVTLRGRRMWEFLDRLVSSALPRIRDFRGLSRKAFDGHGNYSLGIHEQVIFPEIDYNAVDRMRGFQIIIVTSAKSDREGMRLLELLGVPFERTESGRAQSRVA